MLMSGSYQTPSKPRGGYTLLEILFVLMLIGLVGSLVVPRVDGLYDSVALSGEREDILNSLRTLSAYTRNEGVNLELDSEAARALLSAELSDGWSMSAEQDLRFLANGFCTGGAVILRHDSGRSWRYLLDAPYCTPRGPEDV